MPTTFEAFYDSLNARWDTKLRNDARDVAIPALGIVGESSEVTELLPGTDLLVLTAKLAEHFKKHIRDGRSIHTEELKLELGDVLHYWCRLCCLAGFTPAEVMDANVRKLAARAADKAHREATFGPLEVGDHD